MCLQQQTADVNSCHSKRYSIPVNLSLKVVSTEMAKKVCPRLRELAPTVRGGITQPSTTLYTNAIPRSHTSQTNNANALSCPDLHGAAEELLG